MATLFFNSYFFSFVPIAQATGGTITTNGSYTIHTFLTSGTFTVLSSALACDILVVAGGGGGGGYFGNGAGGGAGGFQYFVNQNVVPGSYTVTVGTGGPGGTSGAVASNGSPSQFGSLTASVGGGGGANTNSAGSSGGSGGGGTQNNATVASLGTPGQGNSGGTTQNVAPNYGSGGGGGAGGAGNPGTSTTGGSGGAGLGNSISGTLTYYSGGGGGGTAFLGATPGIGGLGGGGNAGIVAGGTGFSGTANTGGGGGGSTTNNNLAGGAGGSGIVIVRYLTAAAPMYLMDYVSAIANATGLYACKRLLTSYLGPVMRLTDPATVLLIHGDNPSTNSTTVGGYIDSSSYNNLITNTGSVVYSTTPTPLPSGTSCLYFNGSSYIQTPTTSAFTFGTNPFTVEFWIYINSIPGAQTSVISNNSTTDAAGRWHVSINTSGYIFFNIYGSSNYPQTPTALSINTWYHVAVTRDSAANYKLYLNGTGGTAIQNTTNNSDTGTTNYVSIGYLAATAKFTGYLDEIRVSRGVARYTANFSPATFPGTVPVATGGTVTGPVNGYMVHQFLATGTSTFTLNQAVTCDILVVGGGGSGGTRIGGGGGAGGYQYFTGQSLAAGSYTVTVGAGGATVSSMPGTLGNNGSPSQFGSLTASAGGGGGGCYNASNQGVVGKDGGSGGGGGGTGSSGAAGGAGSQGFGGGSGGALAGGGGGGAGAVGSSSSSGGVGGIGLTNTITGISVYYAGGGGGCVDSTTPPLGGNGGGGAGSNQNNNATAATPNTGGGGGGARNIADTTNVQSGAGGSGIVIVRYLLPTTPVTDPSFANVALLLHCDGNNGVAASSTAYYDSSPLNAQMTVSGPPTFSNTPVAPKFGKTSLSFNNSYVQTPTNANYVLGSKDFTIEFWIYLTGTPSGNISIFGNSLGSVNYGISMYFNGTTNLVLYYYNGSTQTNWATNPTWDPNWLNNWTHFALVRNGTSLLFYVNGALSVTNAVSGSIYTSGTDYLTFGSNPSRSLTGFTGYLDDIRVTIGTARYTSNFTVPTSAFPDLPIGPVATDFYSDPNGNISAGSVNGISYTSWALANNIAFAPVLTWYDQSTRANHARSVPGSWPVYDPNNNLVDFTGSVVGSYGGNSSGNNFMSLPDGTVPYGSGQSFTLAAKHGVVIGGAAPAIITGGTPGTNLNIVGININGVTSSSVYFLDTWGTNPPTTSTYSPGNTITYTYGSSTLTPYVNGVVNGTTTFTLNATQFYNNIGYIQSPGNYNYFNGQINFISVFNSVLSTVDRSIVESQGNYFDPYYYNTVLLLKGDSQISSTTTTTTIVDSSLYGASMTAVNGASIASLGTFPNGNKTFGNAMQFFQNSNKVYTPTSALYTFGTNNFTMEFWIYITNTPGGNSCILSNNGTTGAAPYWHIYYSTSNLYLIYANNLTLNLASISALPVGSWTHFALVRNGTSFISYVNGIFSTTNAVGASTALDNVSSLNSFCVGADVGMPTSAPCYLDDVRITNGVARYLGNFNVPLGPSSAIEIALPIATGGTVSGPVTIDGVQYIVHQFLQTGTSTFELNQSAVCDILVVAGGGAGNNSGGGGGGGGAGGFQYFTSQSLAAGAYTVTVGVGGTINPSNITATASGNSQFGSLTASIGGGLGLGGASGSNNGGSGGGGYSQNTTPGTGTAGQGNSGGTDNGAGDDTTAGGGGAGGIGGAGSVGNNSGGIGLANSITGVSTYYAGGGGGGNNTNCGQGGKGGGGGYGVSGTQAEANGINNTGGGGRGQIGNGGSGIVIVRYPVGPTATIINGSIEIPALAFNTLTYNPTYTTNWAFTGGNCGIATATAAGANLINCSVPPVRGNQSLWVQYNSSTVGTATTNLTGLTYGYQYTLGYFYARRTGNTTVSHTVKLNGNVIKTYQNAIGSDVAWTYDSYSFIATNSAMTLVITSGLTSGTDQTMVFDNFTVVADTASSLAWPPVGLTGASTTLSGQTYGNGAYTVTSSSNYANGEGYRAFDKTGVSIWSALTASYNTNTPWATASTLYSTTVSGTVYNGEWVNILLPSSIVLTSYSIMSRGDSPWYQSPSAWVIAGSNNGGTTWTLVDTQSLKPFTTTFQTQTFTLPTNSKSYNQYQIINTAISKSTQDATSIAELILYAAPPASPTPLPAYTTTNLLGYWDFGVAASYPGTGTTINDLSPAGNNLTSYNGGYSITTGGAISGVFSASTVAQKSITQSFSSGATFEYLVNFTNFANTNGNTSFLFFGTSIILVTTNTGNLYYYTAGDKTTSYTFPLNTWVHIMVSVDSGGNYTTYANSAQVGSVGTGFVLPASTTANLGLGDFNGTSRSSVGNLAMARVYTSALTAAQVQANYVNVINKLPGNPYGLQ